MNYSTSIRKMPEALKSFIADWSPITQRVLDMLEELNFAGAEGYPAVAESDGPADGAREEVPFGFYF